MLTEIGLQLGIDHTFLYQFVLIAILYFLLGPFYFRPFQKLFHLREANTTGTKAESDEINQKALERLETYKIKVKDLNSQVKGLMKVKEEEGLREAARLQSVASAEARVKTQTIQKSLVEQREVLTSTLTAQSQDLAGIIVGKIMGLSKGSKGN